MIRVFAFAREAGGAAAIAPVMVGLQESARILVMAKDHAEQVFHQAGLPYVRLQEFSSAAIRSALVDQVGADLPDVVVTSATAVPERDMTERHLWSWARSHGVPSIAVVDQWQYYGRRFSGPGPDDGFGSLPDWISIMDEHAKLETVAAGIDADRIVVTGQPAFDKLARLRETFDDSARQQVRRDLGVLPTGRLVCFVAEALAAYFGDTLGYTEQSVLRDVVSLCRHVGNERDEPLHLAVKLHPQNVPEEFAWLGQPAPGQKLRITVHGTEQPPLPLVMASDVVLGMTSVLLVESILVGRPTISFQPAAKVRDKLVATVVGAIPLIDDQTQCRRALSRLLDDPDFRTMYLQGQSLLAADGGATQRVMDLVKRAAARGAIRAGATAPEGT